jgi:hypothetical protein
MTADLVTARMVLARRPAEAAAQIAVLDQTAQSLGERRNIAYGDQQPVALMFGCCGDCGNRRGHHRDAHAKASMMVMGRFSMKVGSTRRCAAGRWSLSGNQAIPGYPPGQLSLIFERLHAFPRRRRCLQ